MDEKRWPSGLYGSYHPKSGSGDDEELGARFPAPPLPSGKEYAFKPRPSISEPKEVYPLSDARGAAEAIFASLHTRIACEVITRTLRILTSGQVIDICIAKLDIDKKHNAIFKKGTVNGRVLDVASRSAPEENTEENQGVYACHLYGFKQYELEAILQGFSRDEIVDPKNRSVFSNNGSRLMRAVENLRKDQEASFRRPRFVTFMENSGRDRKFPRLETLSNSNALDILGSLDVSQVAGIAVGLTLDEVKVQGFRENAELQRIIADAADAHYQLSVQLSMGNIDEVCAYVKSLEVIQEKKVREAYVDFMEKRPQPPRIQSGLYNEMLENIQESPNTVNDSPNTVKAYRFFARRLSAEKILQLCEDRLNAGEFRTLQDYELSLSKLRSYAANPIALEAFALGFSLEDLDHPAFKENGFAAVEAVKCLQSSEKRKFSNRDALDVLESLDKFQVGGLALGLRLCSVSAEGFSDDDDMQQVINRMNPWCNNTNYATYQEMYVEESRRKMLVGLACNRFHRLSTPCAVVRIPSPPGRS